MPKTTDACNICGGQIDEVFDPATGTRRVVVIGDGEMHVSDRCFVADEIHFNGRSRLVFVPREQAEYYEEYFVVCRKLFVNGGRAPTDITPCRPGDPGQMYPNSNAITWWHRLRSADAGADPPKANNGVSHDPSHWEDEGQGNHGSNGGHGADGDLKTVNDGEDGRNAPNFNLLALEVDIRPGDHLVIDFDGQNGGQGSRGQDGGDGGDGMGGRDGKSDNSWPGKGCDREPGKGGDGGNGGDGCHGGDGGKGGNAGDITIISISDNISGTGPFVSGRIHYINDGGDGGEGGLGGVRGRGGRGGRAGLRTTRCGEASDGQRGDDGVPQLADIGSEPYRGADGSRGASGNLKMEEVEQNTCADDIPLVLTVVSVTPNSGSRGDTVSVAIKGTNFDVSALSYDVTVSGLGVTTDNIVIVDSTTITCDFAIGPAAPVTSRDVTVRIGLSQATLANGFTVTA